MTTLTGKFLVVGGVRFAQVADVVHVITKE